MKLCETVSALVVALAVVLTGCGSDGDAAAGDEPTAEQAPVADDVDPTEGDGPATDEPAESEAEQDAGGAEPVAAGGLTAPGTMLGAGETATLLEATSDAESVVEATVSQPRVGDISDLADHELPDSFKDGVPHYLDISVRNVGDGDLSNGSFRLQGLTSGGQLIIAAVVPGFDTCDSESFPSGFTNGESVDTCVVFMLPDGDSLAGVQYVPDNREEGDDPIRWQF